MGGELEVQCRYLGGWVGWQSSDWTVTGSAMFALGAPFRRRGYRAGLEVFEGAVLAPRLVRSADSL